MVVQQIPPPHAEVLQNLAIGLDSWDNVVKVKMVYTPGKVEGAKSAPGRGEGLRSTLGRGEGLRSTLGRGEGLISVVLCVATHPRCTSCPRDVTQLGALGTL